MSSRTVFDEHKGSVMLMPPDALFHFAWTQALLRAQAAVKSVPVEDGVGRLKTPAEILDEAARAVEELRNG